MPGCADVEGCRQSHMYMKARVDLPDWLGCVATQWALCLRTGMAGDILRCAQATKWIYQICSAVLRLRVPCACVLRWLDTSYLSHKRPSGSTRFALLCCNSVCPVLAYCDGLIHFTFHTNAQVDLPDLLCCVATPCSLCLRTAMA